MEIHPTSSGEGESKTPPIQQIENYKIVRQIGQGAMGIVYEAYHSRLGRKVALKVLPSHLALDHTFVRRFRNEAAAAARMNHPNIAMVYDYGETPTGPFIAMEYIQGRTLEEVLAKEGLAFSKAVEISEKLADALAFAHERGITHRDLKASNVMLDDTGRPVMMDFGLAKIENATLLTIDGTIMGTPAYMAPELARSDPDAPATNLADVYSLGVVMYEMFTKQLPFQGTNHLAVLKKVIEEDPKRPRQINMRIPKDLEVIILKAMEKEPSNRYPSAQALADDLKHFQMGDPIWARPTHFFVKVYRKSRKHRGILRALGITFLAGLIWTYYLVHQQHRAQLRYQEILHEAQTQLKGVQQEKEVLLERLSEDPIFQVLQSKDPMVRAQAIITLNQKLRDRELKGKLEKKSFELTLGALDDPHPLVRRHAAILLGILKDARAKETLSAHVEDEDSEVRRHTVLALGLLQDPLVVPRIIPRLKDEDAEVRASAALSLGLLKAEQALSALTEALQDPFPKVRSHAAASLGSISDPLSIPFLIPLLQDPVSEVEQSAQEALASFGEPARLPMLLAVLENPKNDSKEIVRSLNQINPEKDKGALDAVLKLLSHPDKEVRYTCVLLLGLFQDSRAAPFLIEALKDPESSVQENAHLALIGLAGQDLGPEAKKWEIWWKRAKGLK